jgi:hypothetical protein
MDLKSFLISFLPCSFSLLHNLDLQGLFSLGDWRWTSADSVEIFDDNGNFDRTEFFNAEGVHVGDAPQTQVAASMRYEPIKHLYFKAQLTWFERHFADFNPFNLDPKKNPASFDEDGNPRDSWKLPSYYLLDFHAGYSFFIKKAKFDIRGSVLNLLDEVYISDATDNDTFSSTTLNHNAQSAGVFFGLGRRFNVSLAVTF